MEDSKIVDLCWVRSEQAIEETQRKYHPYCFSIANNILPFRENAEKLTTSKSPDGTRIMIAYEETNDRGELGCGFSSLGI